MSSITAFLSWYLIVTLLGWLTFPLVYALFPGLADRGYSLARASGLLVWGYAFWLLNSLGLLQNDIGGILFALLVLAATSLSSFLFLNSENQSRKSEILIWLRSNLRLIITAEVLFLVAFAFLAFIRAGNPELDNAEKPMELMFINAILRSPTFPPHDSWLSGYAISYYYFGYVMAAMLAMLTGLTGSVAHNLMTSLIFALAAVGSYGILYDLLAIRYSRVDIRSSEGDRISNNDLRLSTSWVTYAALLAPLFLLLVSNLEGFLEVLHRAGVFWSGTSNFWTWLGIKELTDPPAQPLSLIPDRFWWWWRASRVITDTDLTGNFIEVIDEFPFFSFLHADLHPHVLAIPFNLLAVAAALNIHLGGWAGETNLFGWRGIKIRSAGFFAAALLLGGLAFLNTWDILIAAALIVLAYVLYRIRQDGASWSRLEDAFALGLPLGFLAILLYLPFYFGFSSQAGGILPNEINPTRGAQLWVMFGPLFVPLFAYLLYEWRGQRRAANWRSALLIIIGVVLFLWAFSWLLGWLDTIRNPVDTQQYLNSQGMPGLAAYYLAALSRRLGAIGGLLTMLALLIPAFAFLLASQVKGQASEVDEREMSDEKQGRRKKKRETGNESEADSQLPVHDPQLTDSGYRLSDVGAPLSLFIFLLILLGGLLVLAPEFIYLRDQFGTRMNTVFKFYYQAWLLWSLAAAFGTAVLLRNLRRIWYGLFLAALLVLLAMALTYPALALANKTNNFQPTFGWTLDDFVRIQRTNPDEAASIQWLKAAPYGTLVEAVPDTGGSYTGFARISEYTGLPAVLGWVGHEDQWRGSRAPQGTRQNDIATLYSTASWETAQAILHKYDIKYVYIGDLERSTYNIQEEKFQRNLVQVFQKGNVTIYEVP